MDCFSPTAVEVHGYHTLVPCGTCPMCLKRRTSQWDFRARKDRAHYKKKADLKARERKNDNCIDKYELTTELILDLTYNTKFLPSDQSLDRRDLQKFLKRFRELVRARYGYTGVRVLYSGEYGETGTHRPHYHLLFWNLPALKLRDWQFLVAKCWTYYDRRSSTRESRGFIYCEIPRDFRNSASYVSKSVSYVVKGGLHKFCRQQGEKLEDFQRRTGRRTLPFVGASLGLGLDYLIEDCDCMSIMKQGYMQDGLYKVSIPRYYANKMKDIYRHVFFFDAISREIVNSEVSEVFALEEVNDIAMWKYASYDVSKQRAFISRALRKYDLDIGNVIKNKYMIDVSKVDTFVDLMPQISEYNESVVAYADMCLLPAVVKYQSWRRRVFDYASSMRVNSVQRAKNKWDGFCFSVQKGFIYKENKLCRRLLNL